MNNTYKQKDKCVFPTTKNYNILKKTNYRLIELKQIAKKYNLKVSGKKKEVIDRIYLYLVRKKINHFIFQKYEKVRIYKNIIITKIQSHIKGYFLRKFILLHGDNFYPSQRIKCVNDCDFLTLDPIKDIPTFQFITITDSKGFIYGFDICSIYNYFKQQKNPFNPYTRELFSKKFINNVKKIINMRSVVNININILLENDKENTQDPQKILENNIERIFQKMDELGNYTNINWLLSLTHRKLIKYICNLHDIWIYRAQLSNDVKMSISPPNGNPFNGINILTLEQYSRFELLKITTRIMQKMVFNGIDDNFKSLGAFYALAGLTLVNSNAADALPWLYASVF